MLDECRQLVASENLVAAEFRLAAYLQKAPEDVEGSVLLGIVFVKSGRLEPAIERLDFALRHDPEHLEALTWSAAARKSAGRPAEALPFMARVLERRQADPEAYNLYGSLLLSQGQAVEAEAAFRSSLSLRPDSSIAHANLGMTLRLQNRGDEALDAFRKALALAPGQAQNHFQLAKQLQLLSRWREALTVLESARRIHPGSILLAEALAVAYGRMGRAEEAERIFREIAPHNAAATNSYAAWLQETGRFEDSTPVLQASLALQPLQGAPYRSLVEADQTILDGKPILDTVRELAEDPRLDDASRMHLAFAMGKLFEKAKDFEAAMRSFDEANERAYAIYPACRTFDPIWTQREPDLLADLYSPAFWERLASIGVSDERPIFIVGMIRSGTTLLDQIVSAHPAVASVGEGTFWNTEADTIHPRWTHFDPSVSEIASLAQRYLDSVSAPASCFTDKMPLNFRHLGLIHTVFPRARFLHIRRNPLDTCLSIYTTFLGGGANFLYSKENIATFYRGYVRAMERWRESLPEGVLFELDYESLVSGQEATTRNVVEFLGLPWDDACLTPSQNRGAITTPSRWQARQPIYASSVERWRRYEPWLGSFRDLTRSV